MKYTQEDFDRLVEEKAAELMAKQNEDEKEQPTEEKETTIEIDKDAIASAVKDFLKNQPSTETEDIKKEIPNPIEVKKDVASEDPTKGHYKYFAEFAKDVADAADPNKGTPNRLKSYAQKIQEHNLRAKTAGDPSLEIGDPEQGGYLVPTEFSTNLLKTSIERSNFVNLTQRIPMQSNSIEIPYIQNDDRSAGKVYKNILLYWTDELGSKTASKPKFGQAKLKLEKLIGMCYSSDELLEDSPISIEPLINNLFADAFAWTFDWVLLNGTGAGQPRGILSDPARIDVAKETGQAADTIVFENIVKMYARMWPSGHKNAIWVANPDTFSQLAQLSLTVGTGGAPAYLPANGISGKPYDTLMGKPLLFSEHAQTLGDLGDIFYLDWSQYLFGEKVGGGIAYDTSIHLKFDYDQTAFRWVKRLDGQGWWPSAETPRYSSDTISPFIALAERA